MDHDVLRLSALVLAAREWRLNLGLLELHGDLVLLLGEDHLGDLLVDGAAGSLMGRLLAAFTLGPEIRAEVELGEVNPGSCGPCLRWLWGPPPREEESWALLASV